MQLTCPSCGARYRVNIDSWPTDSTAAGDVVLRARKVRCKACSTQWSATPATPFAEPRHALHRINREPEPEPETSVYDGYWDDDRPSPIWKWVGRSIAVALLACLGLGFAFEKQWVAPQALGLPTDIVAQVQAKLPRMSSVSQLVNSAHIGLPDIKLPSWDVPKIDMPQVKVPAIKLPRAEVPDLAIHGEALKRTLPDEAVIWEISGVITNPTERTLPVPQVEVALLDNNDKVVNRWIVQPEVLALAPSGEVRFESSAINPPATAERLRVQLKPAELGRL